MTSAARGDLFSPACPTRQFLDRVGGKWTSMLVKVLAEAGSGKVRFAELRRRASRRTCSPRPCASSNATAW